MRLLANRTQEIDRFRQMLAGATRQRILLVEAPSGYGKTNLLLKFEQECQSNVLPIWVDLKSAQTGVPYVLSRIRRKLGEERCLCLRRAIKQFLTSGVQIDRNVQQGQDNLIQVLNVEDENTRNFRLVALRDALFQDLNQIDHPILLILDTFDEASDSLALWIEGSFLAEAADTANTFVVVAGQKVPRPSGEWINSYHHCRLDAILDLEAWYKYAKDAGLPFNRDEVSMAIRIFGGLPADIVKTFETLARQQVL